jgi:glycosyltransferase involved in cell wall biosynthesis
MPPRPLTLAHVTHEAVEQLGGIGTVLEGLMSSPAYQKRVRRSILIGPAATHPAIDPAARLGEHGRVLYSSVDQIDTAGYAGRFRPIEWAFNVAIIYGKRTFQPPGQNRTGEAEVLLIDVFRASTERLNVFKLRLWETFGLDSSRYEKSWDYEEWVRLAEPAFYALQSLLTDEDKPCVLFSHEFMGMPTALQAVLDGGKDFRTLFHAHECATARRLVEDHPGHDTVFYNVLEKARQQGRFVEDVFGPLDHYLRHALISRAHLCDGVIAVGDHTRSEMQFLGERFLHTPVEVVYNGVPAARVTLAARKKSRRMLLDYSERLVGYRPDFLLTHVTRPVVSKGLWRDVKLCHHLHDRLVERNQTAALYILTTAGGVRRPQDVRHMEAEYGWPRHHREGFPDLVGPEVDIARMIEPFNGEHPNLQIILVNQFGWSRDRIGRRLPKDMDIADFRRATDAEFGMATYEPFGISPLEPLASGAICVISNVCGCENFVHTITDGKGAPNVLTADFTRLPTGDSRGIDRLLQMTAAERDAIEQPETARVADELHKRLPTTDAAMKRLIESGTRLAAKMSWDRVVEHHLLPLLDNICAEPESRSA